MAKLRLDQALVDLKFVNSREQGKRLIMAGEVMLGTTVITKPGWPVKDMSEIHVKNPPKYVGRGGLKLEGALQHFGVCVAGLVCMDIGSSTGGFTDCLLQHGAARIYAFDVGTNQMVWKLRNDPRVKLREQVNARYLKSEDVPEPVQLMVADLSFISLTLVLPACLPLLDDKAGQLILLIKPQFELSREEIGVGGIVRDELLHQKACQRLQVFFKTYPEWQWDGVVDSPITGTDGNREFLALIKRKS
jgi:23S rRNA (cytidine1920-2'-O)/16S rRNA (cytidine1409-2'-O)-methyltransferase